MVIVEYFRIKNYRSIKDTDKCYLDEKITVLAGKNGAGKTAILEALEDFNSDKGIREEAKPIQNNELKPEIELTVKLRKKELKKITEKFSIPISKKEVSLQITKVYPSQYSLSEESISVFTSKQKILKKNIHRILIWLKEKAENIPFDVLIIDDITQKPDISNYVPKFKKDINEKQQEIINKKVEKLKHDVDKLNSVKEFQVNFLNFLKQEIIPNFILFKKFDDVLPDRLTIPDMQNNALTRDLGLIHGLDFDKIQPSANPVTKRRHVNDVSKKLAREYKKYWKQDKVIPHFWQDGGLIHFTFVEKEIDYPPRLTSDGKKWHLAFYTQVTAKSQEDKDNIILIDEPGLFLHAKAQKDVLKQLEKCAKRSQVIYATHSPYLIQTDKLHRVRLIERSRNGTKIKEVTAKADKETLTPILTAIGEDLSVGIRTDKKNSVVLEGFSDYLYLSAFKKLLDEGHDINFIPATGGDTPVYIGSILFGWGLDPIFVLDNDSAGRKVKKKLRKKLSIPEKNIILIPHNGTGAIENLFSEKDCKSLITRPDNSFGKVLLAKKFLNEVEKGKIKKSNLSDETKQNFIHLFHGLKKLIR